MADRAPRTAATAENCPSIMASNASPGSQASISAYRGLARSVLMDCSLFGSSTRVIESRSHTLVPRWRRRLAMRGGEKTTKGLPSRLGAEAAEAPAMLQRQAQALERPLADLVAVLRSKPPRLAVTCARGSSAHAATYGKHLFERHLGIPVCAAAPNIASIYQRPLDLEDQLFVSVSQSGRSPDILASAAMARESGAITVALVNDTDSPLAQSCEFVLPMAAGPETSVAASKSFIASLAALLQLTALWTEDSGMMGGLGRLPARLADSFELDWSAGVSSFSPAHRVIA